MAKVRGLSWQIYSGSQPSKSNRYLRRLDRIKRLRKMVMWSLKNKSHKKIPKEYHQAIQRLLRHLTYFGASIRKSLCQEVHDQNLVHPATSLFNHVKKSIKFLMIQNKMHKIANGNEILRSLGLINQKLPRINDTTLSALNCASYLRIDVIQC